MVREKRINPRGRRLKIGDQIFITLKEASEALGIDRRRLRYLIDNRKEINGEIGEWQENEGIHEGMGLLRSN